MTKILHVIGNLAPRYGGPSKACFEMAKATVQHGHEVAIYTTNQDGPDQLDVPLGIPIEKEGVMLTYFPIQQPRFLSTSWPMYRTLKESIKQFDIVHIHSLYLFHSAVVPTLCKKHQIPYLIRPHGTLDPYIYRRHRWRKRITEFLFQNKHLKDAAGIHCTTEEEAELAKPYLYDAKTYVIPNGLFFDDYENLPEKGLFTSQYPELKNKKIILFMGRINFKKGIDILVKSMSQIVKKHLDAHLVLAGPDNDDYLAKIYQWIREEDIKNSVTYVGMVQGKEKLALLRDADIFVLPSYTENFGISVVEAMACGLPVVISTNVNIWHEIKKADAGIVTECAPMQVSDAIVRLLSDKISCQRLAKTGKTFVQQQYAWDNVSQQLINMYRDICRKDGVN